MEGQELTVRQNQVTAFDLPDEETLTKQIEAINRFQSLVHKFMVEGQDYGVIPGTNKPSLLKPGAEKITKLLSLADTYGVVSCVEDWDKPLFRYMVKCTLSFKGMVVSEGMGECNSLESKYRWRDAKPKCPVCGKETIIKGKTEYGGGWLCFAKKGGCGTKWDDGDNAIEGQQTGKVPNDDIFSLINTILKMAEKRALVDAALHAGRLSNVFTQDVEDMPQGVTIETAKPVTSQPEGKGQPASKATPESKPLDPLAVYNKISPLAKNKVWTEKDVRQALAVLGATDSPKLWDMVKGLPPEKLVEFDNLITKATQEKAKELFE